MRRIVVLLLLVGCAVTLASCAGNRVAQCHGPLKRIYSANGWTYIACNDGDVFRQNDQAH